MALQKLQTLYAKGIRAVHAGLTSREASGEKPFADQNKVILFSAWSTLFWRYPTTGFIES